MAETIKVPSVAAVTRGCSPALLTSCDDDAGSAIPLCKPCFFIIAVSMQPVRRQSLKHCRCRGCAVGCVLTPCSISLLQLNSTLQALQLRGNQMGVDGVQALAAALQVLLYPEGLLWTLLSFGLVSGEQRAAYTFDGRKQRARLHRSVCRRAGGGSSHLPVQSAFFPFLIHWFDLTAPQSNRSLTLFDSLPDQFSKQPVSTLSRLRTD